MFYTQQADKLKNEPKKNCEAIRMTRVAWNDKLCLTFPFKIYLQDLIIAVNGTLK